MKLSVIFPNVFYREGQAGVTRLIQGIERIGFHELGMFDHVVMGYPTEHRRAPFYPPTMPIMEAFSMLAFAAGITSRIQLGTGVLVLPQRNPTLVAKQAASIDLLSGGRLRLGVGTGWQRSEYEALGESYDGRGERMDEAIAVLRACWQDSHVHYQGAHYQLDDMAFEPKPRQGSAIPIWIGGTKPAALRRVARLGDGWMAMNAPGDAPLEERLSALKRYAEEAGRDPTGIGMQMTLSPGPLPKEVRKRFFADPALLLARTQELAELGFRWAAIDCVPIFQHGYRTVDALLDYLGEVYDMLSPMLEPPPESAH